MRFLMLWTRDRLAYPACRLDTPGRPQSWIHHILLPFRNDTDTGWSFKAFAVQSAPRFFWPLYRRKVSEFDFRFLADAYTLVDRRLAQLSERRKTRREAAARV